MGDLAQQWAAIKAAPLLYLAALAAVALIEWAIIHFLYKHRIEGLKERIDGQKDQIGKLKEALSLQDDRPSPIAVRERQAQRTAIHSEIQGAPKMPRRNPVTYGSGKTGDDRVFVHKTVKPSDITQLFKDGTHANGERQFTPYIGKFINVSCSVIDVSKERHIGWLVTTKSDDGVRLLLWFGDSDVERIEMLKKGDPIAAVGEIWKADALGMHLVGCRLI